MKTPSKIFIEDLLKDTEFENLIEKFKLSGETTLANIFVLHRKGTLLDFLKNLENDEAKRLKLHNFFKLQYHNVVKENSKSFLRFFLIVLIISSSIFFFFSFRGCSYSDNRNSIQKEFESSREVYFKEYKEAENEIQKSKIFNESRKQTCEFEKKYGRKYTDWVGKIIEISTNRGGSNVTGFKVVSKFGGFKISYEYSLMFSKEISESNPVYQKLSELKKGDKVCFSFEFTNNNIDSGERERSCFDERSITESGAIEEPEFSVDLIDIKKCD